MEWVTVYCPICNREYEAVKGNEELSWVNHQNAEHPIRGV